jgi:spore coat protein CotH
MLRIFAPAILTVAVLALTSLHGVAQSADTLFDGDALHDIRILINSKDLQQLRLRSDENTFYAADLQWQNLRIRNVGIRSRGGESRSPTKPGLEIEFARYVTGQRFLGLDTLVLDNLWQDPAMIRERVAMAFFKRAGVPAPRATFARVFINSAYQGVYAVIEGVDASFLERNFDDKTGYLFEFHYGTTPFHAEYLGSDPAAYKPTFEPRTHRREPDAILYSPIRDLFREINEAESVTWSERVDALVDIDALIGHLAVETYLAESDGLAGSFIGMNNFYLYRSAASPRHRLIPWDRDLSFFDAAWPILPNFEDNELFRRLMSAPDLFARYLQKLDECVRLATEDDWLMNEIDRTATLIAGAAYEDRWKPFSNEGFDEAVAYLRQFARSRPGEVTRQLETLRQDRR